MRVPSAFGDAYGAFPNRYPSAFGGVYGAFPNAIVTHQRSGAPTAPSRTQSLPISVRGRLRPLPERNRYPSAFGGDYGAFPNAIVTHQRSGAATAPSRTVTHQRSGATTAPSRTQSLPISVRGRLRRLPERNRYPSALGGDYGAFPNAIVTHQRSGATTAPSRTQSLRCVRRIPGCWRARSRPSSPAPRWARSRGRTPDRSLPG